MDYKTLFEKAKKHKQEHIFQFWEELSDLQKEDLLSQVNEIDFKEINRFNKLKDIKKDEPDPSKIKAPTTNNKENILLIEKNILKLGEDAIAKGELACLLVAGGQGSRLGFDGPKGCFKVSPVANNSLFEMFANQVIGAQKKYSVKLHWYIMTSLLNDKPTKEFFEENDFFGLKEDQVHFFSQKMLPSIDEEGKLMLNSKHEIVKNPNGSGGIYEAIGDAGLIKHAKAQGIKYFSFINVDNGMVEIFDPAYLGAVLNNNSEFGAKVINKTDPNEPIGMVCVVDGVTQILEYVNISKELMSERKEDGSLLLNAGSINLLMLNVEFIEKVLKEGKLEYSVAHKQIPHLTSSGELVKPKTPNGYKFEKFVFDVMPYANNITTFEIERNDEFAPVKNSEGKDSPQTAKDLISNKAKRWMLAAGLDKDLIDGLNYAEISPAFALTKEDFIKKVKDKIVYYENEMIDAENFCFD